MTQQGNLFDGILFPSCELDAENGIGSINGVIRLVNNYEKIYIENISIGLNSSQMKIRNDYPEDVVYNSFLDNVRLKVEKGRVSFFDKVLVDYTSLRDLLFDAKDGEYSGYNLVDGNKFSLNKGDSIDLKYTLQMVEKAGNELQSVTAYMPIYINLQGNQIIDDGGGDDDNGDSYDKESNDKESNDSSDSEDGNYDVIIPPIDIPEIDDEEIVIEDEEIIIEDEEVPKGPPSRGLPKTGSTSSLLNVGLATMF